MWNKSQVVEQPQTAQKRPFLPPLQLFGNTDGVKVPKDHLDYTLPPCTTVLMGPIEFQVLQRTTSSCKVIVGS
jgi:hypothetical protein